MAAPAVGPFGPDDAGADRVPLRPRRLPHLVEYSIERVLQPGYSFSDEFELGPGVILDAFPVALGGTSA